MGHVLSNGQVAARALAEETAGLCVVDAAGRVNPLRHALVRALAIRHGVVRRVVGWGLDLVAAGGQGDAARIAVGDVGGRVARGPAAREPADFCRPGHHWRQMKVVAVLNAT